MSIERHDRVTLSQKYVEWFPIAMRKLGGRKPVGLVVATSRTYASVLWDDRLALQTLHFEYLEKVP